MAEPMTLEEAIKRAEVMLTDWTEGEVVIISEGNLRESITTVRTLLAAAKAREGEVRGWMAKSGSKLLPGTFSAAKIAYPRWGHCVPVAIREIEEPASE